MHLSVRGNIVKIGHSVFCNIKRQMVTLCQETDSVIQCLRCHWPACACLSCPRGAVYIFWFPIFSTTDHITVIYILSHKIERLMNEFHIFFRNLRKIWCKFLKSFFRVLSQKYRIGKPCHIPGPVIHWVVKTKIYLFCSLYILCTLRCRICHTTGRCIADTYLLLCIFTQIDHCLTMCFHQIVCHLKGLWNGILHSRCMYPA